MEIVRLRVNGDERVCGVPAHYTLLETLRYGLGLTGSKQGCDKGDCGACTVIVDGRAILSCITPVWEAEGRQVRTVEGLADGTETHPVQDEFDLNGAAQCGFCTPGILCRLGGAAGPEPIAEPRGDSDGAGGQPVPLHRLREDLRRRRGGGREAWASNGAQWTRCRRGGRIGPGGSRADGARRPGFSPEHHRPPHAQGRRPGQGPPGPPPATPTDIRLPGMLHGKILRSPHPHARIVAVDTSRAEALEGVRAVVTGRDMPTAYGIHPLDARRVPALRGQGALRRRRGGGGGGRRRGHGHRGARPDRRHLRGAARLPGPPRGHRRRGGSVHPRTAQAWVERQCDQSGQTRVRRCGRRAGRSGRRRRERLLLRGNHPHAHRAPLRNRAWPRCNGKLTVWSATQVPHYLHRELARVLEVDRAKVRVIPAPGRAAPSAANRSPSTSEFCGGQALDDDGPPGQDPLHARRGLLRPPRPPSLPHEVPHRRHARGDADGGGRRDRAGRRRLRLVRAGDDLLLGAAAHGTLPDARVPLPLDARLHQTSPPAGPSAATARFSRASPSRCSWTGSPSGWISTRSSSGGATSSAPTRAR